MLAPARRTQFAAFGLCIALAAPAAAQVRASERSSVSQTIDGTLITIDYARPQVRGRSPIFGGFVHWKEVWTPGANYATTIEVNRPVQIDGHAVRPGKYSMWLVVGPDQWIMVLDPRAHMYHTEMPDSTPEQIRYVVHPGTGPFTEILTFGFTQVRPTGATLQLRWGTTELDFKLIVEPKHRLTMTAADAQPYLGTYLYKWSQSPDSTPPSKITMVYENGMLIGHWSPAPWPEAATIVLVGIAKDWYIVGTIVDGELTDLMTEFVFEFSRGDGKVTGFEARGGDDELQATAKRE